MLTCPAVNVDKYTIRLSSSVSTQSSLIFCLHTHELVMLWLNCRAKYVSPDCSPPNFTKVVLGVNIHMHTMATKRVHKWIDYHHERQTIPPLECTRERHPEHHAEAEAR